MQLQSVWSSRGVCGSSQPYWVGRATRYQHTLHRDRDSEWHPGIRPRGHESSRGPILNLTPFVLASGDIVSGCRSLRRSVRVRRRSGALDRGRWDTDWASATSLCGVILVQGMLHFLGNSTSTFTVVLDSGVTAITFHVLCTKCFRWDRYNCIVRRRV